MTQDQDSFALDVVTVALKPAVKDPHPDVFFDGTVGVPQLVPQGMGFS